MLIKISLMAEITDAGALREAALKNFDAADITSDDHPDTADWHASEEGQEERRLIATEDKTALHELLGEPMLPLLRDASKFWGANRRASTGRRHAMPSGSQRPTI